MKQMDERENGLTSGSKGRLAIAFVVVVTAGKVAITVLLVSDPKSVVGAGDMVGWRNCAVHDARRQLSIMWLCSNLIFCSNDIDLNELDEWWFENGTTATIEREASG